MTSYIDPSDRFTTPPLNPSASMANRAPRIPATQQLDLPRVTKPEPGYRYFDAKLGCWCVAEPKAHAPIDSRRPRRLPSLPKTRGRMLFSVIDWETGAKMGVIAADEPSQAQRIASEWYVACGEPARAVYVR